MCDRYFRCEIWVWDLCITHHTFWRHNAKNRCVTMWKCCKNKPFTCKLVIVSNYIYIYKLHVMYIELILSSCLQGSSWPWWYGSWIHNYLCNRYLSPLMLEFKSCSWWGVQHYVIKFVSDLQQVSGFLRVLQFHPTIKLTATI